MNIDFQQDFNNAAYLSDFAPFMSEFQDVIKTMPYGFLPEETKARLERFINDEDHEYAGFIAALIACSRAPVETDLHIWGMDMLDRAVCRFMAEHSHTEPHLQHLTQFLEGAPFIRPEAMAQMQQSLTYWKPVWDNVQAVVKNNHPRFDRPLFEYVL